MEWSLNSVNADLPEYEPRAVSESTHKGGNRPARQRRHAHADAHTGANTLLGGDGNDTLVNCET